MCIFYCYQVSNPGQEVQTLGSAFLNIMWPYELANGKWLLYPASLKFENHPDTRCTLTDALNPLKLSHSKAVEEALQSQHLRVIQLWPNL